MSAPIPEVISNYFELDARRDVDAVGALFAEGAAVIDERQTWNGAAEIRAWLTGPAAKYTYTTELDGIEPIGPDRYLATGRLTGNFPGGTADLKWDFTIAGDRIARLEIAP